MATRLICDSFISNQNVQCFVLQTLSERSVIFYIWLNVEQIGAHKQVVQLDSAQCFTARSPTPRKVSQLQSISPRIKSELGWSSCDGICLAFIHKCTMYIYLAKKPDIYRCICSICNRLCFYAAIRIILSFVRLYSYSSVIFSRLRGVDIYTKIWGQRMCRGCGASRY